MSLSVQDPAEEELDACGAELDCELTNAGLLATDVGVISEATLEVGAIGATEEPAALETCCDCGGMPALLLLEATALLNPELLLPADDDDPEEVTVTRAPWSTGLWTSCVSVFALELVKDSS